MAAINILIVLLSVMAAVLAVSWVYPKTLRIAKTRNLVDCPDDRKLQKEPVPALGGMAVAFGVFTGLLIGQASCIVFGVELADDSALPLLVAMAVLLLVGGIDDAIKLSVISRFFIEFVVILGMIIWSGACIDSFHGLWGVDAFSWYYGLPLSLFAGVGIINAINMLDGVNGLSASLCLIGDLIFGLIFSSQRLQSLALVNYCMAASLVPFLIHNVMGKRSKMYLGDAGTMMLGILMCYNVIQLLRADASCSTFPSSHEVGRVAVAMAILAVPIADTLRVMTMRMISHRSPFSADKTHFHHYLMDFGHSHALTTIVEVLIALLIMAAWTLAYFCEASVDMQFYVVLISAMILVWGLTAYLYFNRFSYTGFSGHLRNWFSHLRRGETSWWIHLQERIDGKMN